MVALVALVLQGIVIPLLTAVWWGVNKRQARIEERLDSLLNGGFIGKLQERTTRCEVRLELMEKQRPCMAEG